MAGDWIKIECTTPDKPEVYRMAEALGIAPEHVTGCLIALWIWADQQTTDGNAPGVTRTLVDRKSGVTGFADAMLLVGWLQETEGGLTFPNFDRHNGKTAKSRALTAKRVAKHKQQSNAKGNADSVISALPREEKRREELKDYSPKGESGSADAKPPAPATKIVELYHTHCQTLSRVMKLTPARQQAIRARWRNELTDLEQWQRYFEVVSESDFLMGRAAPRPGSARPFQADFDWLLKQSNCVKIMEGKYD